MPITEKDLINGFLSKTLNIDAAGVASLYNEDGSLKDNALQTILEKDADRVKSIKPDTTDIFNDAHKKAKAEVMKNLEKEFAEKTSFKSDKKGIELFLAYAEEQRKKAGDTITEDEIKKHPTYISAVDKLTQEKEEAVAAKEKEFNDFKQEQSKRETFSSVSSKALEVFNSLKPMLSKDAAKAKNQMEDFVAKLKSYDYEIQGDKVVVLKDGKVVEDAHGHRISFENIVKETAHKYYDFYEIEQRQSSGNGKQEQNGQAAKKIEVPTNEKEYAAVISDPTIDVKERRAISEAYKAKQNINV